MCLVSVLAHVTLVLHLFGPSISCQKTARRPVLTASEYWSLTDLDRPNLSLSTLSLNNSNVCVRATIRMRPLVEENRRIHIVFLEQASNTNSRVMIWRSRSKNNTLLWKERNQRKTKIKTNHSYWDSDKPGVKQTTLWKLEYDCFQTQPGYRIHVSVYQYGNTIAETFYTAENSKRADATVPEHKLYVDQQLRRVVVDVKGTNPVNVRLCYSAPTHEECKDLSPPVHWHINSTHSSMVNLTFPFLLPCLCVQLHYAESDARRIKKCPFEDMSFNDGSDVLASGSVRHYTSSSLLWQPVCHSAQLKPSASLCWNHHGNLMSCAVLPNTTLPENNLIYNMSAVDEHPQMCVKFSLNGAQRIECPFQSGLKSQYEIKIAPGSLGFQVYFTSKIPASFAAQLCVWESGECVAKGNVHIVETERGFTDTVLALPVAYLSSGLCVKVWRSYPPLYGQRIICPVDSNRRWGLIAGAAFVLVLTLTVLGLVTFSMLQRRISVWKHSGRRPVLLVCSSDDAAHVSAVCALASGLQGELCVGIRLAQWAQCGAQTSLAQLGPAPWFYGQYQAVQQGGGKVLIAWSSDARKAFHTWREREMVEVKKCKSEKGVGNELEGKGTTDEESESRREGWMDNQTRKKHDMNGQMKKYSNRPRERLQECKKEEMKEEHRKTCSSSITGPVFNAALSCLWMELQGAGRGQDIALIYFQGQSSSCHIPKDLRGVQRYCLPRDLPKLVQELTVTGSRVGAEETMDGWQCWPQLLSKMFSLRLSRQLAKRLSVWHPQTGGSPCQSGSPLMLKLLQEWKKDKNRKKTKKKKRKGRPSQDLSQRATCESKEKVKEKVKEKLGREAAEAESEKLMLQL
ncbi:uncharacterized protein LOC115821266 isoform X2 [Chanos chanos]|uniref:Uncharacterized protein LOC115821266 isoform X2 n=1 Tax=Chanos chanos TaxID=29144 RepID=A0A6J2W9B8_CHACN|nr:interleukin-17 receptor E isoform X2 [Chanos chanos]